jgi:hypothetical protein
MAEFLSLYVGWGCEGLGRATTKAKAKADPPPSAKDDNKKQRRKQSHRDYFLTGEDG